MTENQVKAFAEYCRRGVIEPEIRALTTAGLGFPLSPTMLVYLEKEESRWPVQKLASTFQSQVGVSKVAYAMADPQPEIIAEGGAYPETTPEFDGCELQLYKIGGLAKVSEELMFDAGIDIEKLLGNSFGRALAIKREKTFINGDGVGKPRGFLIDCQTVNAAGTVVSYSDVVTLYQKLTEETIAFSSWLTNRDTLPLLTEMVDAAGNKVLTPDLSGETAGFILGLPVYVTFMPTDKPLAFGDFSKFVIMEQIASIKRLEERFKEFGIVGFTFFQRLSGRLVDTSAIAALSLEV